MPTRAGRPVIDPEELAERLHFKGHPSPPLKPHKMAHLPTRVLDLAAIGSGGAVKLLVQANSDRGTESEKYCTLTHCWGFEPPLRTTKALLDGFCKKVLFLSCFNETDISSILQLESNPGSSGGGRATGARGITTGPQLTSLMRPY